MSTTMPQIDASVVKKWKRYPAYKDSGVEWLGEVPEDWDVNRLKFVARVNPITLGEDTDPDYILRYIDIGNLDSNGRIIDSEELRFDNAPSRARRLVTHGDTIISTVRTYLRAIGFIEEPPENLIVSTGFTVLRPGLDIMPEFLFRLIQSSVFVEKVVANSEGVAYPAINPGKLASFSIWLPPASEQVAIIAYLERETAKIDALIGKREQLIELLKEKRAALISHAVTKGLDPTVKMKDSGVEWLREVPEGWIVKRLKYACQVNPSKSELADLSAETQVSFLPMELVGEDGMLSLGETRTIEQVWEGYTYFRDKDVIVAKITPCFENGKGALCNNLFNGIGFGTTELYVLRAKEGICPKYIYYLTKSRPFRALGAAMMHGTAGQQRVPDDFVKDFRLGFPSINEQQAIADFLDRETAKIDALINKIREGIEKLKEYRTALISAAVTGKIDVRGEVS